MMRKGLIGASVLWATFSLLACSPPAATEDAGSDASVMPDTRADVVRPPVDAGPPIGSPCTAPGMCGGTTAVCNTFFPGGSCSVRCTSSRACGEGAVCSDALGTSQCYKACSEDGGECGAGEVCALLDSETMERACIPSCAAMPSGSEPRCNAGNVCEPYSGFCVAPEQAMAVTGADNGAACENDEACKSRRCFAEVNDDGQQSGFVGGYCFSTARSAAPMAYRPGAAIPRSTCPPGSVSIPFTIFGIADAGGEGDPALCLRECQNDSQCRPGYTCDRLTDSMGRSTTNGFCFISNCLSPMRAMMVNNGCPTGYSCVRQMGTSTTPVGSCQRMSGTMGDAGTPPADGGAMPPADAGTPSADGGAMTDAAAGD